MKSKRKWIKELNENDISILMNKDESLEKAPIKLRKKIFNFIDNLEIQQQKIKNPNKNYFSVRGLRPAFVSIVLTILLIPIMFIYFNNIDNYKNTISAKNIEVEGKAQIINKNGQKDLLVNNKIRENNIIKTDKNSTAIIKIGEKIKIKLDENTEIKTQKLATVNKNESIEIYLSRGMLNCDVKLPTKESTFIINTDLFNVTVKGTKFSVEITETNQISVNVEEGSVEIDKLIKIYENLEKIKSTDENFYNTLKKIIYKKIIIEKGLSFYINKKEISEINNDLNNLIIKANLKINAGKTFNEIKTSIHNITDELNKKSIDTNDLKLSIETDKKIENIENNNPFLIEKINSNQTINLSEKNTSISNFKNYILICSDLNKTLYCIDSQNGKIIWQFNHEKLKNITSCVFDYNDDIVLVTPDNIFIINKNGIKKEIYDLNNGLLNWANPIKYKGLLLIPTNRNIFKFDGKNLLPLENYIDTMGQIYISLYNNYLFCVNLNERIINAYDLNEKKVIWKSDKFNDRVFNSPVFTGKHLYVADIKNKIYKYDFASREKKPLVIDIDTGVLSNMIYYDNCIYFIGNNGFFYKYKSSELALKIQIDNNPIREKYFTKKLLKYNEELYFSSDSGKLFNYNIKNDSYNFIEIPQNKTNKPLLGSPIQIKGSIYTVDSKSNVYKIVKKK